MVSQDLANELAHVKSASQQSLSNIETEFKELSAQLKDIASLHPPPSPSLPPLHSCLPHQPRKLYCPLTVAAIGLCTVRRGGKDRDSVARHP